MSEQILYQTVSIVYRTKKRDNYQQPMNFLHEELESSKKIVKQDGYKYLKKAENISFRDS